jgi:hypothetical protein
MPSSAPAKTVRPDGDRATAVSRVFGACTWPRSWPLTGFHSLTVPSSAAEVSSLPSREKAMARTAPLCPRSRLRSL